MFKKMILKRTLTILLFLSCLIISADDKTGKVPVTWNGYSQLRFTSNFSEVNTFAMRRMKLWINSAPGFNDHWGFHLQTTISSKQNEMFNLQDVLVYYKTGRFRFNMGQFVPHYSLQRFQHDYTIPLTERSEVINNLIPNGTLGVRDIGIEANYTTPNERVKAWIGVFNGYGIKDYRYQNSGILLTQKTECNVFDQHFRTGYSAMYRRADQIRLLKILPDSVSYSGNDVRLNLFALYRTKRVQLQKEYLMANLNGKMADGWYLLADVNFGENQVVASLNTYNDLITETDNFPEVHLGYNHKIHGENLKVMLDNRMNLTEGKLKNYFVTLQLQLFFN
jgi:hypothetical protein